MRYTEQCYSLILIYYQVYILCFLTVFTKHVIESASYELVLKWEKQFLILESSEFWYIRTCRNRPLGNWNLVNGKIAPRGAISPSLDITALEESVDWALLSSFCDDSNMCISIFKQLHSTGEISKESIAKFNRKSISRKTTHHQFYTLFK